MLSKQAIDEYKEIYKKEFDKTLSDEEAAKKANDLLNLFKTFIKSSNINSSAILTKKNKKLP